VMRKMIAGTSGTALNALSQGQSQTLNFKWKIANIRDLGQLRVVAFVQTNSTKEVRQAVMAESPLPFVLNMSLATNNPGGAAYTSSNNSRSFNMNFTSTSSTAQDYKFIATKTLSTGWTANFTIDGTTYSDSVVLNLGPNVTKQVTVNINANGNIGKGTVIMSGGSVNNLPNYRVSNTAFAVNTMNGTLYVHKPNTSNTNYVAAFTANNRPQVQISASELTQIPVSDYTFDAIKRIVYNTGNIYGSTLTANDIARMQAYLDNGGRVFFMGDDIGYDAFDGNIGSDQFVDSYLGAGYANDKSSVSNVRPVSGELVLGGQFTSSNITNQYPDVLLNNGSAITVLTYGTNADSVAMLRKEEPGVWKTALLGCTFANIQTASARNLILGRTLDWFDGLITGRELDEALKNINLGQNFPNPANQSTTILIGELPQDMTLNVFDVTGKQVYTTTITKNTSEITISTADWKSGVYFYELLSGNQRIAAKKLTVAH
ncbi:MAG: T9SS type A sorting domain-containing protein, partial [Bacteroidia bacterium]|nr:T9SS type A sorting domain-containing protein [Bacteroidia bacterium]